MVAADHDSDWVFLSESFGPFVRIGYVLLNRKTGVERRVQPRRGVAECSLISGRTDLREGARVSLFRASDSLWLRIADFEADIDQVRLEIDRDQTPYRLSVHHADRKVFEWSWKSPVEAGDSMLAAFGFSADEIDVVLHAHSVAGKPRGRDLFAVKPRLLSDRDAVILAGFACSLVHNEDRAVQLLREIERWVSIDETPRGPHCAVCGSEKEALANVSGSGPGKWLGMTCAVFGSEFFESENEGHTLPGPGMALKEVRRAIESAELPFSMEALSRLDRLHSQMPASLFEETTCSVCSDAETALRIGRRAVCQRCVDGARRLERR